MIVAQVVPWLLPGDALSNDAMAIGAQLGARGPTTLHCCGPVHPGLAGLVTPGDAPRTALMIVHLDERIRPSAPIESLVGPAIARLHGLDPASPSGISFGRYELVLANSSWTADGAAERGARNVQTMAPFLPLDGFMDASPSASNNFGIVTVGPFRASDRLADAVLVDHLVRAHFEPRARLRAIGRVLDVPTRGGVTVLSDELRLGSPWAGHLGHDDYVREIAAAGVLLHCADSTFFGAALVEAMAAGTPVVARAGGATAETLGGAGVLLAADADLTVMAEAVHAVLSDVALRHRLREAGRVRAAELAPVASAGRLAAVLTSIGWW